MKTRSAKASEITRKWFVVDASGQTLGRLAAEIAVRLRGKHKPEYTPHVDTGDYIIVVNAEKITVTGNKRQQKIYYRHSGYPGGLRALDFASVQQKKPHEIIRIAVRGMLPHNRLGRQMLTKLKIYVGDEHPHSAHRPQPAEFGRLAAELS